MEYKRRRLANHRSLPTASKREAEEEIRCRHAYCMKATTSHEITGIAVLLLHILLILSYFSSCKADKKSESFGGRYYCVYASSLSVRAGATISTTKEVLGGGVVATDL